MKTLLIELSEALAKAYYALAGEYDAEGDIHNTFIDAADALSDAVDLLKESE